MNRSPASPPRTALLALAVLATAVWAGAGTAATPSFVNGDRVATAMERHYNSAGYKNRLAKAGGKVRGRVLCAYDGVYAVECTGRLAFKGVPVDGEWTLVKRTATRAKLSWVFEGDGVFQADGEVVAPSAFALPRF